MSYLHSPRLVFTGDFQSDVSTVNNDTQHYNNATFEPSFQLPDDPGTHGTNGWWNPEGGAVFNFLNCTVQQVCLEDGTEETKPAAGSLIGLTVGGAEGRPTGKMVDLDPDMQMVSALWCVQLRIYTAAHELLLQGDLNTTSFRDLQMRQTNDARSTNGQALGGTWTSVLTNVVWGERSAEYPFLSQLKKITQGNRLSVNLNAFGYHYNHTPDGRFALGRIIGAIGPWFYNEPETFAPARRLYGMATEIPGNPATFFTISNFLTEPETNTLTVDFGSSFPVADALGTIAYNKPLMLAVSRRPVNAVPGSLTTVGEEDIIPIGKVAYEGNSNWLMATGGIVSFRELPAETMAALAQNQLLLLTSSASKGQFDLIAREAANGLVVRADNFVQRLDSGDTNPVYFYACQWGRPLAGVTISMQLAAPTPDSPVGPNNPICEVYGNNFPAEGLTFAPAIVTDANGFAPLSITGNAIHSPRVYIDGQIYTLNYQLQQIPNDFDNFAAVPDAVMIHLRDDFEVPENPVWDDIAPTMIQYSNLYPIMSKYVVNLADPQALIAQKKILLFAFTRDINDTMHMPVTRDLSNAKRQTILKWLNNPRIVETIGAKAAVAAGTPAKPRAVNPVPAGAPLTAPQRKLREAAKAKSGALISDPVAALSENK